MFLPSEGWLRAQQRGELQSFWAPKAPLTPGTPAAGSDVATMIYRPINRAFPNPAAPPSMGRAMNFLSVKATFHQLFCVCTVEKSLNIWGREGVMGVRMREWHEEIRPKSETQTPPRHKHHSDFEVGPSQLPVFIVFPCRPRLQTVTAGSCVPLRRKTTHVGNEILLPPPSSPTQCYLSPPDPPPLPAPNKCFLSYMMQCGFFFFWTEREQLFLSQLIFVPRPHKAWGEQLPEWRKCLHLKIHKSQKLNGRRVETEAMGSRK